MPPIGETLLDEGSCPEQTMLPSEKLCENQFQVHETEPSTPEEHIAGDEIQHNTAKGNAELEGMHNNIPLQSEKPVTSPQPGECMAPRHKLFFLFFWHTQFPHHRLYVKILHAVFFCLCFYVYLAELNVG